MNLFYIILAVLLLSAPGVGYDLGGTALGDPIALIMLILIIPLILLLLVIIPRLRGG